MTNADSSTSPPPKQEINQLFLLHYFVPTLKLPPRWVDHLWVRKPPNKSGCRTDLQGLCDRQLWHSRSPVLPVFNSFLGALHATPQKQPTRRRRNFDRSHGFVLLPRRGEQANCKRFALPASARAAESYRMAGQAKKLTGL